MRERESVKSVNYKHEMNKYFLMYIYDAFRVQKLQVLQGALQRI